MARPGVPASFPAMLQRCRGIDGLYLQRPATSQKPSRGRAAIRERRIIGRGFLFRFRETVQNRKVGVRPNPPNGGHLLGRRPYPVTKSASRRATNSAACSSRPPMICSSVTMLFFIVRLLVPIGVFE